MRTIRLLVTQRRTPFPKKATMKSDKVSQGWRGRKYESSARAYHDQKTLKPKDLLRQNYRPIREYYPWWAAFRYLWANMRSSGAQVEPAA